jgi:uncharacterized protein
MFVSSTCCPWPRRCGRPRWAGSALFPMRHLLAFMDNHAMLQISNRPELAHGRRRQPAMSCRAARAGAYVDQHPGASYRASPRSGRIRTDRDEIRADAVILACHSDQALKLLADPDRAEQSVLGAIAYQPNETVLHTDSSVLPRLPQPGQAGMCAAMNATASSAGCPIT